MKLALITPIPDLERFATMSKVHLVLPEYLHDERYLAFYRYRRSVGDYLIMDNGAHEHAQPLPISALMIHAAELQPQEIVLPDVQRDADATIEKTQKAFYWLSENQATYESIGRPRLHIVPQGTTMDEWTRCRSTILALMYPIGQHGMPVIGIAKHHEDLITGGILRLVASCRTSLGSAKCQVHLLGWPRNLHAVKSIAQMYPEVRSIDTARPFAFAKYRIPPNGAPHQDSGRYPSRDADFFTDAIDDHDRDLAIEYIRWFQQQAGDAQATA